MPWALRRSKASVISEAWEMIWRPSNESTIRVRRDWTVAAPLSRLLSETSAFAHAS